MGSKGRPRGCTGGLRGKSDLHRINSVKKLREEMGASEQKRDIGVAAVKRRKAKTGENVKGGVLAGKKKKSQPGRKPVNARTGKGERRTG